MKKMMIVISLILFTGFEYIQANFYKWEYLDWAPVARIGATAAQLEGIGKLIIFGGSIWETAVSPPYHFLQNDTWVYDENNNTWLEMNPAIKPNARYAHCSSYIGDDKIIVFGGFTGQTYFDDTWIYDLSDNNWTNMDPLVKPSARMQATMAYAGDDKIILYGGNGNNDTWLYDLSDNIWINLNPSSKPTVRYQAAMCIIFDDKYVLFGGTNQTGGELNDTWIYDLSDNTWTLVNPLIKPSGRHGHTMSWIGGDKAVLYGGGTGITPGSDETWIYDFSENNWIKINPAVKPPVNYMNAFSRLADGKVFLCFSTVLINDTWIYDISTNTWSNKRPSVKISDYGWTSMSKIGQNKALVFLGSSGGVNPPNETWLYEYTNNLWTKLNPSVSPSTRRGVKLAYLGDDKVLMFGGYKGDFFPGIITNETWIYDLSDNTWSNMDPFVKPSARNEYTLTYIGNNKVMLFGGNSSTVPFLDDTWIYDFSLNTWTNMNPATKPQPRYSQASEYIGDDKVLLTCGYGESIYDDTWIYDYSENTWTNQNPVIAPPPRHRHGLAKLTDDKFLLFGGYKNISTNYGDTWVYDISDNQWTNMVSSPQPMQRQKPMMSNLDDNFVFLYDGTIARDFWVYKIETFNLDNGLVAYYPFIGNLHDVSGNNNHGQQNNPNWAPNFVHDQFNCPESAVHFDGVNDYFQAYIDDIDLNSGAINTVCFWIYWNYKNSLNVPFCWNYYSLNISANWLGFNTGAGDVFGTLNNNHVDRWCYIVAQFKNGNVQLCNLYIDGIKKDLSQLQGIPNNSRANASLNPSFSKYVTSPYYFQGKLDEVRIYNRALSESEIQELYAMGSTCSELPQQDLVLYLDPQEIFADGPDPDPDPIEPESFFDVWYDQTTPKENAEQFNLDRQPFYTAANGFGSGKTGVLFSHGSGAGGHGWGFDDVMEIKYSPDITSPEPDIMAVAESTYVSDSKNLLIVFKTPDTDLMSGRQILFEAGETTSGFNVYLDNGDIVFGMWNRLERMFLKYKPSESFTLQPNTIYLAHLEYNGEAGQKQFRALLNGDASGMLPFSGLTKDPDDADGQPSIGLCGEVEGTRFHDFNIRTDNYAYTCNGLFGDVLLYNKSFTPDEMNEVYSYLNGRYGQGWTYPADQPSKSPGEWIAITETEAIGKEPSISAAVPNPFNDRTQFSLSLPEKQIIRIELFDALGSLVGTVFSGELGSGTKDFTIDGTMLVPGLYTVRVSGSNMLLACKVIVMK